MSNDSKISLANRNDHCRIISVPKAGQCLDTDQLNLMEGTFRHAVDAILSPDISLSRQGILIVFRILRYTGAKLSEVLAIHPVLDRDPHRRAVFFQGGATGTAVEPQEVQIAETLATELHSTF